jgi:AraC family transcriptional activator of pobA
MNNWEGGEIERFDFLKKKYGKDLLVDIGRIEVLKNYVLGSKLHYITFYEVLVITDGKGTFSLDDKTVDFQKGTVVVTLPNQIRRWHVSMPVRGYCFFFEGEFLNNHFRDEVFLNRFTIFDYSRPFIHTQLTAGILEKCLGALEQVEEEFELLNGDSSHIFRSLLYYAISLIDHSYKVQYGIEKLDIHPIVYRFKKLLNSRFKEWHTVSDYAESLSISHNHLNSLCKNHLSKTALEILHERLLLEAKRDILFSSSTVGEVAYRLGYKDVSNFNRFFKKQSGCTPKQYKLRFNH